MSRLSVALLLMMLPVAALAEAEGNDQRNNETFDAKQHTDWGSYYDPQNIFCGKYDCYKILGFDYESYDTEPPSKGDITKRYRSLSRLWHPDKNKARDAKDRFVKIARAYEVLTDVDTRKEYDFMRYNQEAYFDKYGSSVLWQYAPKSDVTSIVVILICVITAFSWFVQKQQWQTVANRLIQAAVEDWTQREGGTTESREIRQKALDILAEREGNADATTNGNGSSNTTPNKKGTQNKSSPNKRDKKQTKLTGKEKKKQLEDSLRPIVVELVNEINDFGAGFHKPTWRDLFLVKLAKFPVSLAKGIAWNTKYAVRRVMKKELSDEEREVLTRRAVGEITWHAVSEEDHKEMVKLDLWKSDNLQEWREAQEVKTWSVGDQKRYARMKKKGFKLHDE